MGLTAWLRRSKSRTATAARRAWQPVRIGRWPTRPLLERLEDRLAPAAVSWTGSAGTLNWGDAANWSSNAVPTSNDDVTINKAGVGTITIGSGTFGVDSLNDTTAALSLASGAILSFAAA